MKKIILSIIAILYLSASFALTTITVIKNTDVDPYKYPYNYDDTKCAPEMYGTLQWAIRKSMDTPGKCIIVFNIPGQGPFVVLLNFTLPAIEKKTMTIDATTQPGYSQGNPQIILDGNNKQITGLYFNNNGSSGVKGMVFKHFVSQAILLNYCNYFEISENYFAENGSIYSRVEPASIRTVNSTNGNIKGNFIGMDESGNAVGNNTYGMVLSDNSNSNTIGGTGLGEGNTIVNNEKFGIWITKASKFNKISGNIIYGQNNAITLDPDGNELKHRPVIGGYNLSDFTLKGSSEANDMIEIFGGTLNQNAYEYITTVQADSQGNWMTQTSTNYSEYFATATDLQNNTSDLSSPFQAPVLTTSLKSTDCDISEVLFSQILTATPVYRAEMYEFMVTDDNSGISENIVKNTNNFSLNELIMPIQLNTAYRISVRVKIGELWGQYGDVCKVKTVKSTTIQACNDEILSYTISGVTTGDSIHLSINLPNEVYGLYNVVTIPPATVQIDTINPSIPQYSFTAPGSTVTLNYHIIAGCGNISPTTQNISYSITQDVNGIITNHTDSFNLNSPYLVFDTAASNNLQYGSALSGISFERTFCYKNTSSDGVFSGVIEFMDTLETAIRVDSVWVAAPSSGTIDVLYSNITVSNVIHKVKIDNIAYHDSIMFKERVYLIDCPNGINNITNFEADYGCDSTDLCVHIPAGNTVTVFDPNDRPELDYTILTPGYQSCWSDSLERVMRIVNTGGGFAESVYIGILNGNALSMNISDINPLNYFKVFKIVGGIEIPVSFNATTPIYGNHQAILTTDTLYPNDTIYLRYYEKINCIDSSDYNTYFNQTTYMHWEGFPWIILKHPCYSTPYEHFPVGNGYGNATWRKSFVLNQIFSNLTGSMTTCDTAWFDISSNSLSLGHIGSYNCNGFVFDMDSAELIVELALDSGLGLVDSNLFLSSVYNNITTNIYAGSFEYLPGPNSFAGGNRIKAHFSFPANMYSNWAPHTHGIVDIPTPDFTNFFNDFKVNFQLFSDCNFAAATASGITEKVFFNPNKNCTEQCQIPLSKVEDDVFILCPGCLLPGWNIGELEIQRINFGRADTNNNNYPDGFPLQTVDTNTAQNQHIILGDTINCHIHAGVSDGSATISYYNCWNGVADTTDTIIFNFANIGFPFTNAQMVFKGIILNNLSFIEGDGIFTDADNGVFSFLIDTSANTIVQNGAFALDIGIQALESYGVSNTVDSINDGDLFDINLRFVVTNNLIFPNEPDSMYNTKGIDAMLNMSGTPYTGIDIMTDAALIPEDTMLAMTPAERAGLNYWCTGNQGNVVAIGTDFKSDIAPFAWGERHKDSTGTFDINNYNPCYYTLGYNAKSDVGVGLPEYNWDFQNPAFPLKWNSFSYELRNLWMLDSLKFSFPDIFELDRIDIKITQLWDTDLSPNNIITGFNCFMFWNVGTLISNDLLYNYDISGSTDAVITDTTVTIYPSAHFSQITDFQGCDSILTAYDETKRYRVEARLKMKDYHLTPNNTSVPEYVRTSWSSFPGSSSGVETIVNTHNLVYSKPVATLQTFTQLPQHNYLNSDLVWNMIVNTIGTQVWQNGLINNRAENSFIYFISPHNNIFVDSLIRTNNNLPVPVVGTINGNNLYGLGTIGAQYGWLDSAHISIYAGYDCSLTDTTDTLIAIYGWNCYGYPDTLENACFIDTTYLIFDMLQTGYQVDSNITDISVNICDTAIYDIKITATGSGIVENIQVNMAESLNNEYSYVQSSAYIQYDGFTEYMEPLNLYTDSLTWLLDSVSIFHDFESDTLHLILKVAGGCGFGNNEIGFTITAQNYCDKPLGTIQVSGIPVITGIPVQDSLLVNVNITDSVSGCGDSTLVQVTITNNGTSQTSDLNTLNLILPNNFSWLSGDVADFVAGQIYTYNLAGNVIPTDSQTIQFYISGVSGSGIYNVIANTYVTQAMICNNDTCIFSQSFIESSDTSQIVVINSASTVSIDSVSCNSYCDGGASIITTGIPPFTYLWSNGGTGTVVSGLCAGNNSVTITDANGCSDTLNFTVPQPLPLSVTFNNVVNPPCNSNCNGQVTADITGGTSPYSVLWSNGAVSATITGLCAGTYFVTATDANGCMVSDTVILIQSAPLISSLQQTNGSCSGVCDGTASFTIISGTPPYTYLWNTGATYSSSDSLCPANYWVTITDINNCTHVHGFIISGGFITPPATNILVTNPDTNCIHTGDTLNLDAGSQLGTNYSWYVDYQPAGSGSSISVPLNDFGYYLIKLNASNACGNQTVCNTVFINPSSCVCPSVYDIVDGTVIPTANTNWDNVIYPGGTITVEGIVRIPNGKKLFIRNLTVQFAPKGKIIVERGGLLSVESSTLTSLGTCGMWQGIEVWGDGSRVSTHIVQGKASIRSSTISNAHIGVLLGKRKLPSCTLTEAIPFIYNYSGGIIAAEFSNFLRNGVDIKFTRKNNVDGVANVINNCKFKCNTPLDDLHYNSLTIGVVTYPNNHNPWAGHANPNQRTDIGIQADYIRWLKIRECTFFNLDYGIFTINNQRTLVDSCRFSYHRQGIHVENIIPSMWNSYDITRTTFDSIPGNTSGTLGTNDGTALYISGGRWDRIHDGNQFNNNYLPFINPVFGIKFNNTSSFDISNNIFRDLTSGVTIQNSSPFGGGFVRAVLSSNIYSWQGNVFNTCKTGIVTKNDNSALCLRCNDHNTDPSNYIINWDNATGGILADQGFANSGNATNLIQKSRYGAGNWFFPDRKIGSISPYNYYHHSFPIEYIPDVTASPIITPSDISIGFNYFKYQSCPLPNILPNINLPGSLNDPAFLRIDSLNNVALILESQYLTLINNADKGHTLELLDAINTVPPTGQLKNMLIANSPLSDTVLITLNNQNPLSNGNYKNVMEENLPVTRNVVPVFNSRVETMPPGIKNQLKDKQANNPGKITLGYLETLLGQAKLTKQLYFNEIISLLLDTLNNRDADAVTLFEQEGTPAANLTLTANYISDSNYSSALSKLALLPDDNSQTGTWKTFATFLLNHFIQGRTLEELDSLEVDYIRTLAYQCPEGITTVNAKAILMYLYREEVPACPENGTRSMKFESNKFIQSKISYLGENYPDPFSKNTVIPYYLPEDSRGELIIKDVTGRIILTLSLQEGEHEVEINSKEWADGIYFYGMSINGENIENKKMIKSE